MTDASSDDMRSAQPSSSIPTKTRIEISIRRCDVADIGGMVSKIVRPES